MNTVLKVLGYIPLVAGGIMAGVLCVLFWGILVAVAVDDDTESGMIRVLGAMTLWVGTWVLFILWMREVYP